MTSIFHEDDSQADRLERMKSEFLAAQQRRGARTRPAPRGPDDTLAGPVIADPADGMSTSAAAVQPCAREHLQ
jgi:hypothetical protein